MFFIEKFFDAFNTQPQYLSTSKDYQIVSIKHFGYLCRFFNYKIFSIKNYSYSDLISNEIVVIKKRLTILSLVRFASQIHR